MNLSDLNDIFREWLDAHSWVGPTFAVGGLLTVVVAVCVGVRREGGK